MSPYVFFACLAVFLMSGIVVLLGTCVLAKRADERMHRWMRERHDAARCEDPLERQFAKPAVEPRRTVR